MPFFPAGPVRRAPFNTTCEAHQRETGPAALQHQLGKPPGHRGRRANIVIGVVRGRSPVLMQSGCLEQSSPGRAGRVLEDRRWGSQTYGFDLVGGSGLEALNYRVPARPAYGF